MNSKVTDVLPRPDSGVFQGMTVKVTWERRRGRVAFRRPPGKSRIKVTSSDTVMGTPDKSFLVHSPGSLGETVDAGLSVSVPVRRFRVRVVRGDDAGREVASDGEPVVVGKAEGVTLRLSDPLVSRFHLELRPVAGGVEVADLGSKNGSFVGPTGFQKISLQQDTQLTLGKTTLLVELDSLAGALELSTDVRFGSLWGESQAMRRAFHLLRRAAQVRSPVLLRGEIGTGKHEAARSLHASGPMAGGEFVTFDCAAVPGPQAEQELLGDEGAWATARGGTLFLHELGELPLRVQAQLVQRLESAEGGEVRVLSSSSQDIQAQVNQRTFRPELYYRLAAVTITLPPLRERREDIPGLVVLALQELQRSEGLVLSEGQRQALVEDARGRTWSGNLRELRAFVEHAAVLGIEEPATTAAPTTTDLTIQPLAPLREERDRWSRALEVRYLSLLLEHTDWNIVAAARSAGVEREYIHRLIKRHGLQRPR